MIKSVSSVVKTGARIKFLHDGEFNLKDEKICMLIKLVFLPLGFLFVICHNKFGIHASNT
jgi:hypothetical protein